MAVIYHERQVKELCAIHALNNLFQNKLFTKSDIDGICENLSPSRWLNPHRSLLGTGNYDINVILAALQLKGHAGIWFDKRKDPKTINFNQVIGFIMNTPSAYDLVGMIRLPLNRRHWYAIRFLSDYQLYYNLDSKLPAPSPIGDEDKLVDFLRTELMNKDRELFLVVTQEVEGDGRWILKSEEQTLAGNAETNKTDNIDVLSIDDDAAAIASDVQHTNLNT